MEHFMAVDEATDQALKAKLAGSIFRSPEAFIEFYNTGVINRKHADVIALAKEISETYRNVEERGGKLTFITQQEIFVDELRKALGPWAVIVRVKRDLNHLLADEALTQNDVIVFSPENKGFILKQNENGDLEKVSSEKLYSSQEEINEVHEQYSSLAASTEGYLLFRVSDFTSLDDSFIDQMRQLLP